MATGDRHSVAVVTAVASTTEGCGFDSRASLCGLQACSPLYLCVWVPSRFSSICNMHIGANWKHWIRRHLLCVSLWHRLQYSQDPECRGGTENVRFDWNTLTLWHGQGGIWGGSSLEAWCWWPDVFAVTPLLLNTLNVRQQQTAVNGILLTLQCSWNGLVWSLKCHYF